MKQPVIIIAALAVFAAASSPVYSDQTLIAHKVGKAPVIDGMGADTAWAGVQGITTHDKTADIDIDLKAVYTDGQIFFLVSFPDADESRTHKSWVWDKSLKIYKMGKDREDVFVFKWNMNAKPVDLSIYADEPYKADIWFWKAQRTDPVGYADDKIQTLASTGSTDYARLTSKTGKSMYLLRQGDAWDSAYKTEVFAGYRGDIISRFTNQTPTGSRADIKAKGGWKSGKWTIEFGRPFDTGYDDDIQFDLKKSYQFGVSRYEVAGRTPDPGIAQPLYGSGDVSEELILVFE